MANRSYNITVANLDLENKVGTGTAAPGTGDFEFRGNLSSSADRLDWIRALETFKRVLESGTDGGAFKR